MQLTRRDALVALMTLGGGAGAATAHLAGVKRDRLDDAGMAEDDGAGAGAGSVGAHERRTMVAIARVVYPSSVTGIEPFVRTYLDRRTAARPTLAASIAESVSTLDDLGRDWHGDRFVDLDPDTGERLLREVGADTADADPAGTDAERVRYRLVNELLFALYASPTGGRLAGIENPQGHPGGLASYREGPSG